MPLRGDRKTPFWRSPVQITVPLTERSTFHQLYRLNSSRNLNKKTKDVKQLFPYR